MLDLSFDFLLLVAFLSQKNVMTNVLQHEVEHTSLDVQTSLTTTGGVI